MKSLRDSEHLSAEGYRCPNCGAMLLISKTYRGICTCQHCGGEYKITDSYMVEPLTVEVCQLPLIDIKMQQLISRESVEQIKWAHAEEECMEHIMDAIVRNLSKKLLPFIETHVERDMCTLNTVINGRIKVAGPISNNKSPIEAFKEVIKNE